MMAHWAFENEKISRKFSKVFLRGLNFSDNEEARPFLDALHHFMLLRDTVQRRRCEWILGISVLQEGRFGQMYHADDLPRLGVAALSTLSDEAYTYVSTLMRTDLYDSVLFLIWRHRKRSEAFTLTCLRELLQLMDEDKEIAKFVAQSSPPTYEYARYTDWFRPFIESYIEDLRRFSSSNKREAEALIVSGLLNKYEAFLD